MKNSIKRAAASIYNLFKNEKQGLLVLFVFAMIIRIIFVVIYYDVYSTDRFADARMYLRSGESIALADWNPLHSDRHPYMIVAPWIPIMVALCYKLFGTAIIPMFTYNIIVGSLSVPVLYYLGKEMFNKKEGWIMAVWAVLLYTSFRTYPSILKEPTLLLVLPLTLLLLVRCIKNDFSWKYLLLSAVSFTVLIHTDERFFVYLPVFILFLLLAKGGARLKPVKSALIWVGLVALLMLPWSIRNYNTFDQVVILAPRTTIFTSKIWGENIMNSNLLQESRAESEMLGLKKEAAEYAEMFGLDAPKGRTKREAQLLAFVHFWQPTFFKPTFIQYGYRLDYHNLRANIAYMLLFGIFIPFYVLGIVLLVRKKQFAWLLFAAIPIIHSLLHAYMVWPLKRYRLPIEFMVVMVGVWAAIEAYEYVKKRKRTINSFNDS